MNVTPEWVKQQAAKASAPVVEGWRDGVLTVFVQGRPRNPLNGSHEHWSKRAKWAKSWRERAAAALLWWVQRPGPVPRYGRDPGVPAWIVNGEVPKRIAFTVYGASRFDDDNVRAVVKPLRDALKDMRLIDDDRDSSGHVFEYEQAKPTRTAGAVHGIAIRVELLDVRRGLGL